MREKAFLTHSFKDGSNCTPRLLQLTQRADFLTIQKKHKKQVTQGMIVQMHYRAEIESYDGLPRVGFTASRRVGGAVKRNRAKRRMRELVRRHAVHFDKQGCDFVLIARPDILNLPFHQLETDLVKCFSSL